MNMVIENVRQLRHDADDSCPDRARRQAPAHLRLSRGRLPAGQEVRGHGQPGLGQSRHRLGHGHAARLREGSTDHGNPGHLSRHAAADRRSRRREPRVLQALRGARLPSAELRRLRPAALSADHGLPVVHEPEVGLGAGRGQGRGALLHRGASRHPAGLQGAHALSDPAGRSRHAEGQADASTRRCASSATSRRRTARWRRPTWCDASASARACAWSSPTWRPGLAMPQWTIDEGAKQPDKPWRYPQE